MRTLLMGMVCAAILAAGCQTTPGPGSSTAVADLDRRHERIVQHIEPFKEGGRIVLDVAYATLREGKAEKKWELVGLEDLWAEAIKEGGVLFNQPDRRWGKTTAEETRDMIGQTTIGPWQITVTNVKNKYGLPYGVKPDWSNNEVNDYIRQHPEIQVKMISDYIQEAYTDYGKRSPYGVQRYFWLEAYVRGWIGKGEWDKSVLPTAPDGDWRKLTPEMKADTGFYAKQLVCGNSHNPYGLLYWLWVSGNTDGIRDLLRTWRDQKLMTWDEENGKAVLTDEPGHFAIHPEDLKYMKQFPEAHAEVTRIVEEVLAERPAS